MNLDQLRSFLAVAEAGGFSRAARLLASTQPTLSRQVKALENELGQPLLERLGRRVVLTDFGRDVAQRASRILAQVDGLRASARGRQGHVTGLIRVGVADSVVLGRFPRILKRFRRHHPAVREHVRTGSSPDILRWVRDGRCDIGLCMIPQHHPGLTLQPLWKDRFVAVVPPRHALGNKRVPLSRFAAERQIGIWPGTLSYQTITSAFQGAGLTLAPDMSFETFHLVAEFVAAGVGVAVCSLDVAAPLLKRKRLARVRVPEIDALTRDLGIVLHADHSLEGAVGAFLEEL